MAKRTANKGGNTKGQYSFAQIPKVSVPRSQFNRSSGLKTSFDASWLIPIYCDEALPGDTFNMKMSAFARLATPIFPVMDNMFMDFFFFAVPNRLLWDNWEKFCGSQDNPGDSTDFMVPTINTGNPNIGTIFDYMGVMPKVDNTFNSLHYRAYNQIWNQWFRSQDLQDSIPENTGDSQDSPGDYVLRKRGKRHDYFTSCLPWPQKGAAVELSLGSSAPVVSTGDGIPLFDIDTDLNVSLTGTAAARGARWDVNTSDSSAFWADPKLETDLSSATAATINSLREAFQIQRMLEKDARGGTRYQEMLKSHFGVTNPDSRMQRPEYLGGGTSRININAVAATAGDDGGNPVVGTLSAYGTTQASGIGFVKSFTEHCVIIGLVNVRGDLTYQQGVERMWERQTRYDYYWPSLSHLGEQEVLNGEIFKDGTGADNGVFGYQERYAEYRYKPSRVTGLLRSGVVGTLDVWHVAQEFASLPALNSSFIEDDLPLDRVIAVPTEPHFIADFYFDLKCARPMPTYSVPGLIDHF